MDRIIIAYYFLATVLPVDKIIGRIYPLFGAVLILMAVGTTVMLIVKGYDLYPINPWRTSTPRGDLPIVFVLVHHHRLRAVAGSMRRNPP